MNDRNRRVISILTIFTIIFTLIGGSLAYWNWSSTEAQRTGVAFTIDKDFSCSADGGQNLNSTNIELIPTDDCTNSNYALQRTIKVTPDIRRDDLTISLDMWLKVNNIGPYLAESENLMYAISTVPGSCKKGMNGYITSGNFEGTETNSKVNLLAGKEYIGMNLPQDTYYLYIWLDAAETNNNTQDQSFDFSLGGECTNAKNLSNTIINLTSTSNSGVFEEIVTYTQPSEDKKVIPASRNSWGNMTLNDGTTIVSEENGEYQAPFNCHIDEETFNLVCQEYVAKFKPLKNGYYDFDVSIYSDGVIDATGAQYVILINDRTYCYETYNEYNGENSCSEKEMITYLTSEDEITLKQNWYGSPEWSSTGINFKFYYATPKTVSLPKTYRYEGKNVNNYLNFNNETWRIIGLVEGTSIGMEKGKYYPKIIKDQVINNISFDYNVFLDVPWGETDMYRLLNDGYYNKKETDYVDFRTTGLNEPDRNLIVKPNWIGLDQGFVSTTQETYKNEMLYRDEYLYIEKEGYIGLMSPSDYGFAGLSDVCQNTELTSYSSCINNNWLYTGTEEWLISREAEIYIEECPWCALGIDTSGNVVYLDAQSEKAYRPVVYLNSSTVIEDGTGSIDDKYEISLP